MGSISEAFQHQHLSAKIITYFQGLLKLQSSCNHKWRRNDNELNNQKATSRANDTKQASRKWLTCEGPNHNAAHYWSAFVTNVQSFSTLEISLFPFMEKELVNKTSAKFH